MNWISSKVNIMQAVVFFEHTIEMKLIQTK